MGRFRKNPDAVVQSFPWEMGHSPGGVPKGNNAELHRSESSADCLHDGITIGQNRMHEQYLFVLCRSRSINGFNPDANTGNGESLEPGPPRADDPDNTRSPGADFPTESEGRGQHLDSKSIQERSKVEHYRIEQPSIPGKQTDSHSSCGRNRPDGSDSGGGPGSTSDPENRELFQPKNFCLFESNGARRIAYRGGFRGIRSKVLPPEMSKVQRTPDLGLVQDQVAAE